MKNIFKFFGIAVLACGMMVACGEDPVEPNDTTPTDNPQPHPQTPKFTVSFNGSTWDAAASLFSHTNQGANTLDENWLILYGFKNADDATALLGGSNPTQPYVSGTMMTIVGSYTNQTSGGDAVTYTDPTDIYAYGGDDQNPAGNYLRWNAIKSTFVENITAIDLTARTMSATFSCDHFDLEQYEANGGTSYGTTVTLNGTLENYGWTWVEDAK